jgi:hypothetical protein
MGGGFWRGLPVATTLDLGVGRKEDMIFQLSVVSWQVAGGSAG